MATKKTPSKTKRATKKVAKKRTAKKAVKKSVAKKAVAKKGAKKSAEKKLVCASGETCFWTHDGQVLEDLLTLRDALDIMHDDVYAHHVTKEKNDFADWVEYVLEDYECATALRKSRKPKSARTVVVRYLRYYAL